MDIYENDAIIKDMKAIYIYHIIYIYIYLADSVFQSSLEAFSRMASSEFQSTNPNLGLIPLSYWIPLAHQL